MRMATALSRLRETTGTEAGEANLASEGPLRPAVPAIRYRAATDCGCWPSFCRLLLWATRNAGGGAADP
jgi:hypothetical protein